MRTLLFGFVLSSSALCAQDPVVIALEPFASGLLDPVDIAHCGDERLFIVEQAGTIRIVDPAGNVSTTPFLDIVDRVNSGGEKGCLGLAFAPDYATSGKFYVHYTTGDASLISHVSRFTVTADPNVADPDSEELIYSLNQPVSNHNGGDVDFGPDGYLYIGFGDGGSQGDPNAHGQDLTDVLGDILRIDVSGATGYTIPADNPWVGAVGDTLPQIWASGLRNPWRWGFDALTGDLWIGDVGQNLYEEVDFWPAGDNSGPNFGWRCYEGFETFNTEDCSGEENYVQPVSVHTHASGWNAVIGGRVYRGGEFPRLFGRYLYADNTPYTGWYSLRPDGSGGFIKESVKPIAPISISGIGENSALELFAVDVGDGTLYRVVDKCPMPAPVIMQINGTLTSTTADSYTWLLNGDTIDGATTQTIMIDEVGDYQVVAGFDPDCERTSEVLQVIQLGVKDFRTAAFQVYPSPTRDLIMLSGIPLLSTKVRVMDLGGRTMIEQAINGKARPTLDLSGLANGNYLVGVLAADGTLLQQRKVMVQH